MRKCPKKASRSSGEPRISLCDVLVLEVAQRSIRILLGSCTYRHDSLLAVTIEAFRWSGPTFMDSYRFRLRLWKTSEIRIKDEMRMSICFQRMSTASHIDAICFLGGGRMFRVFLQNIRTGNKCLSVVILTVRRGV